MEKRLASIYLPRPTHPASFGGLDAVYRAVREEGESEISRKQAQDWLSQQDVYNCINMLVDVTNGVLSSSLA